MSIAARALSISGQWFSYPLLQSQNNPPSPDLQAPRSTFPVSSQALSEEALILSMSELGVAFIFSFQLLLEVCFSNLSKEQTPFREKKNSRPPE